ncbi:MAG: hypothetical protein IH891_09795 [Planctomycetes bacterium]|nr:hypothetical protein [Planctomycetota bacterium]
MRTIKGEEYGPADLDQIVQWAREGRIPRDALLYPEGGGDPKSVFAEPRLASILSAPPTAPTVEMINKPLEPAKRTFFLPTGNQPALWSYYLAVFSYIMWPLMPVALALGVIGLVRSIRNPEARGGLHALIAIVLSLLLPVAAYYVYLYLESF